VNDRPVPAPAVSPQTFRRLPYYLQYLRALRDTGAASVSAPAAAARFGFTEVQVRKDFAAVSQTGGRPKHGFDLQELIEAIERALGYHSAHNAVLIGAGSLGRALLSYDGFRQYGVHFAAAFDADPALAGTRVGGVPVLSATELERFCRGTRVGIGILTVPAPAAQAVCDRLVGAGVPAVWNFAPVHLVVPEGVLVQNENMASSLAMLSKHLRGRLQSEGRERA